jgi:hypothetical protein
MKTPTVEIKEVTPIIAAEWLSEKFDGQRCIRDHHVHKLASDMEAGIFEISPDAILRVKGKLANGQHRLSAVVKSGKKQKFIVMESDDDEIYKIIDCGLKRRPQDGLIGIKHAAKLPSISRWLMAYNNGKIFLTGCGGNDKGRKIDFTQAEIINYCRDNESDLVEAASFVAPLYDSTGLLNMSVASCMFIIAKQKNILTEMQQFLTEVYLGGKQSSAGDLRNRLILNKSSRTKLPAGYVFAISVKAFKSFTNGIRSGTLKMGEKESFPRI